MGEIKLHRQSYDRQQSIGTSAPRLSSRIVVISVPRQLKGVDLSSAVNGSGR